MPIEQQEFSYGIVSREDIQSVANAIKAKAGISTSLVFPDGFVTAINNIEVGYVSGDINKTVTGSITPSQGSSTAVDGHICGDIGGTVYGNILNDHYYGVVGSICGGVSGNINGGVNGNIYGIICGNICGTLCGNVDSFICGAIETCGAFRLGTSSPTYISYSSYPQNYISIDCGTIGNINVDKITSSLHTTIDTGNYDYTYIDWNSSSSGLSLYCGFIDSIAITIKQYANLEFFNSSGLKVSYSSGQMPSIMCGYFYYNGVPPIYSGGMNYIEFTVNGTTYCGYCFGSTP